MFWQIKNEIVDNKDLYGKKDEFDYLKKKIKKSF